MLFQNCNLSPLLTSRAHSYWPVCPSKWRPHLQETSQPENGKKWWFITPLGKSQHILSFIKAIYLPCHTPHPQLIQYSTTGIITLQYYTELNQFISFTAVYHFPALSAGTKSSIKQLIKRKKNNVISGTFWFISTSELRIKNPPSSTR